MIDTERFAALEAQVAALTLRDERRESEHRHLLNAYGEVSADREKLRHQLEEDYTLLGKAFDDRIIDLAQRISTTDGGGEVLAALLPEFVKDTAKFVNRSLDRLEVRIMSRVADLFEKLATTQGGMIDHQTALIDDQRDAAHYHTKLLDRVEALERRLCGLSATR